MKIKSVAAAALLAIGCASACAGGGPLELSTGSAGFSSTPIAGGFSELFTFTVTTLSLANSSVTAVLNGTQDVDFTSIVISGPAGNFAFSLLLPDPVEVWALPVVGAMLTPGAYTRTLTGVNSAAQGSYGGNIAATPVGEATPTSPMPETATYVLLVGGLGALGFIASRRRRR